ncbi:hypothetical protein BKA65DRAFT_550883 [Rhexocercosporidium sp. MPI-PUGE-AT-0058]|nr:hypothetical protein BKA65DRAFT_550883 [Rhexocercosporidium sp. MPI-PUGE-AT-0058]
MESEPIPSLSTLPSEILQQISTYLPPSSVICLLLVNRSLKRAVDHWSMWRSLISGNPRFPNGILSSAGEEGWKRYVLADIKARRWQEGGRGGGARLILQVDDLRWLPMLMAIHHPILRTITPGMARHLAIQASPCSQATLFERSSIEHGEDQKRTLSFPTNPKTSLSNSEWKSKLAGSFCLAVAHMSSLVPQDQEEAAEGQDDNDENSDYNTAAERQIRIPHSPQLSKVPWFNIHTSEPSLSADKKATLVTALHALALTAIAHFSTELALAILEHRTGSTTLSQISHPPNSSTLPLSHLPSLPDPLSTDCVEKFGTCHLKIMATPEFFEEGEWTGAYAYTGLWGVRNGGASRSGERVDIFNCVGGVNRTVRLNGLDRPNERFGFVVEERIRFRRVADEGVGGEGDVFVLRSNCFYSQMGTHVLELRVRRSTGLIGVREWNAEGVARGNEKGTGGGNSSGAVLTPFGVVGAIGVGTSWMWLWRREWSGGFEGAA